MSTAQRSPTDSTAAPALLRSRVAGGGWSVKALARTHGGCGLSNKRLNQKFI